MPAVSLAWMVCLLVGAAAQFLPDASWRPRLLAAIALEKPDFVPPAGVTGIAVPHHILAADLIARGFWAASAGRYDRIVLLSPDHFRAIKGPFATYTNSHASQGRRVPVDMEVARKLLDLPEFELLEPSEMEREHGVQALLPFIAHFFPDVPVVPVISSIFSNQADWKSAVDALIPFLTDKTLIIQSTDYSHYLPISDAVARDQETLSAIAHGDPSLIARLHQPEHMDSKASQFLHMILQREIFKSQSVILGNRNSLRYGSSANETTSYVVTAYLKDARAGAVFSYEDQTSVFFAGDVLLGRFFTPHLADPDKRQALTAEIRAATRGKPLIINLEGTLFNEPVVGTAVNSHAMVSGLAGPILHVLNVVGASLANNHSHDFGAAGAEESRTSLQALDIAPLNHGKVMDFDAFRVLALNFVPDGTNGENYLDGDDDLSHVCDLVAAAPLIAFVHWGKEYVNVGSARQKTIADRLHDCGVTAIIGHHSHVASTEIEVLKGGAGMWVYSLGNFLFDQSGRDRTGAMVEMRVFENGTVALRLVDVGNMFLRLSSELE